MNLSLARSVFPVFLVIILMSVPDYSIDLRVITADSLFEGGRFSSAESLYRTALESVIGRERAWALKGLGNIAFVFGRLDSAEQYYQEALLLFKAADQIRGQVKIGINLGSVSFQRSDLKGARAYFEKALALMAGLDSIGVEDIKDRIAAQANLGQVSRQAGDMIDAEKWLRLGLNAAQAIGYERGVADNLFNLGDLFRLRGDVDSALAYYERSVALFLKLGHFKLAGDVLRETGGVYRRIGDFDKAYAALFQALAYLRSTRGNRPFIAGEAELLNGLGLLNQGIGNLNAARTDFLEARAMYKALGDSAGLRDVLVNLGSVYLRLAAGDSVYYDTARGYYQRSLDASRTASERAQALNNLGVLDENRGRRGSAEKYYRQALKIYRDRKEPLGEAQTLNNLGNLAVAAGDDRVAVRQYEEALGFIRNLRRRDWEGSLLANLGHARHQAGQIDAAIADLDSAVRIIETLRQGVSSQEFRSRYLENRISVYEELVACRMEQGKVREAFECAERAKARAFLDLVAGTDISARPDLPDTVRTMIRQEREAEKKIEFYAGDTAQGRAIIEHELILSALVARYPEYRALATAEPVTVDELQTTLDERTAVLEYFVGRDAGFAFCVTRDRIAGIRLGSGPDRLYMLVDSLRRAIRVKSDIKTYGSELFRILVSPLMQDIAGHKRLCIIPHSALHHLPFVCLPTGKDTASLLLDDFDIFYAPSASSYCLTRRPRRGSNGPPALFAKSKFQEHPEWFDMPLPGTARERDSLLTTPFFKSGRVFTDTDDRGSTPTETCVKDSGALFSALHFATHGKLDPDSPLESRIILSADDRNDGNLTVREIFTLALRAGLVTMSACQTGQLKGFAETGKYQAGDELTGLSRAFLFAGVPSVVASLWKVSDNSTVLLMTDFYRRLPTADKAAALCAAQRWLRASEYYRPPFYWAAFVVIGDGD